MSKTDTAVIGNPPNSFTPPNNRSLFDTPQHDTVSTPATTSAAMPTDVMQPKSEFEYLEIELINTSSKSDNGINKQALLKAFDNLEPPFDKKSYDNGSVEASFREYLFQGKRTYGVYLNDVQIGDVPEYLTQYIYDNIEFCKGICDIDTFISKKKEYCAKITLKFSNVATPQPAPPVETPSTTAYEFVSAKIAGVTFNNDDGESRQTYLSLIRFKRPPFSGSLHISLKQYDFCGDIAYAVFVNDFQIGNIPKSQIAYIHENFDRIFDIPKIKVYGGGQNKAGQDIDFGAEITIRLYKDKE